MAQRIKYSKTLKIKSKGRTILFKLDVIESYTSAEVDSVLYCLVVNIIC